MATKVIEQAKEGFGSLVGGTRDVVNHGLDTAEASFDRAANNLDRRYRRTAAKVRRGAENAQEALREGAASARVALKRVGGDLGDYVAAHPGRSLLVAAAVGFVAARAMRRH